MIWVSKFTKKAPDEDSLVLAEETTEADDDAAEEAAAALTSVDNDFGRTTDPVRMYMREMGTVELLTREKAKLKLPFVLKKACMKYLTALSEFPASTEYLLDFYAKVEAEEKRLTDLISDFVDPNAERHVIPEPAPIVTPESKEEAERKAARRKRE